MSILLNHCVLSKVMSYLYPNNNQYARKGYIQFKQLYIIIYHISYYLLQVKSTYIQKNA